MKPVEFLSQKAYSVFLQLWFENQPDPKRSKRKKYKKTCFCNIIYRKVGPSIKVALLDFRLHFWAMNALSSLLTYQWFTRARHRRVGMYSSLIFRSKKSQVFHILLSFIGYFWRISLSFYNPTPRHYRIKYKKDNYMVHLQVFNVNTIHHANFQTT